MKTIYKSLILYIGIAITSIAPSRLLAQVTAITFDTDDYAAVGVYDAWEQSPFRTGQLSGNAAVVDGMLALQRSRFGSNTFGVRIDLKEPFRLTKKSRYLHVMVASPDKPAPSRMMAIGLGKRVENEWAWQKGEDEQFWALTASAVEPSEEWQDVVFSFKGFSYSLAENAESGIDIYSLVIVPDVRSPHADTQDFVCYFDEFAIDDNPARRFSTERYAIGFDKAQAPTRTDRHLNKIGLRGGTDGTQTATMPSTASEGAHVYNDLTATTLFTAKAGSRITPTFDYTGAWMSAYVYLDWANDGNFSPTLADNMKPAEDSDVISYNALEGSDGKWYKSDGTTVANGNQIAAGVPAFTIPAATPVGFYRMRYKVDWNSIDPAGNITDDNHIVANGGGIADVMVDIHGDKVRVSDQQLNGAILSDDGTELNNLEAPYGKPFTIRMAPAPGFSYSGITVRYGYNLDGAAVVGDNPQYFEVSYDAAAFDADNRLTLPATIMRGAEVHIEGFFIERTDDAVGAIPAESNHSHTLYDLSGRPVANHQAHHSPAIYIQNGRKVLSLAKH